MAIIQKIIHKDKLIAIIVKSGFRKKGIEFFTPRDFSQQLAYMSRPAGYKIDAHIHKRVRRRVFYTQETIFVKSGKVKVDFYTNRKIYIQSEVLESGDILLLASGGHGFTFLESSEMIEVKQGPYSGDADKVRFEGV